MEVPTTVEPRIAVIKIPDVANKAAVAQIANELAKAIGGRAFIIPLNFEIVVGNAAKGELERFHQFVHQALGIPWIILGKN